MSQPYAPPRDPTEVLGRRSAAFLIDAFFLAVIGVIVLASANHRSLYDAPPDACSTRELRPASLCFQISDHVWTWSNTAVVRSVVLVGIAVFLDLVVLQTLTGASIGKLCVGLRVVEVQGNEARFLRVLGRCLFLVVDLGCFIVGLVTTLVTHPHRRVGDLVCGTYVVGVASVGNPVVVLPPPAPAPGIQRSGYGAPPGAPVPPGWGSPGGWAAPPAPVPTPPGTSPTTPGEWGAVARPGPALVRSPQWEAPPPGDQPVPVSRESMAPQWATPPGPKDPESEETATESESEALPPEPAAETPPVVDDAPEPVPAWSPVVPLTTAAAAATEGDEEPEIPPPPPPPTPWSPVGPAPNGNPTPDPEPPPAPPAPPPPTEPSPPPPTEPDRGPPAAAIEPEPEVVAEVPEPVVPEPEPVAEVPEPVVPEPEPVAEVPEPDDDVPWWDAEPSRNDQ